jgi:hypothetical protein
VEDTASGPVVETGATGGDPVCWLHLVCESCGALLERPGDPHRPGCENAE